MEIDHGQLPENGRQLIDAQDGACRKRFFGNSKIHWQKSSGGTRSVFIRAACMAPDTLAIRPRRNGPRQNESWQAAWHGSLFSCAFSMQGLDRQRYALTAADAKRDKTARQ